jgi:hypothetical protein
MDAAPYFAGPPAAAARPVAEAALGAPGQGVVSAQEAQAALVRLSARLSATRFVSAKPSQVPGLVVVRTAEGQVGYTDRSGRYFLVGVIFDTYTGQALDRQMDGAGPPH